MIHFVYFDYDLYLNHKSSPIKELYITHQPTYVREGDAFLDIKWKEWKINELEITEDCSFVNYVKNDNYVKNRNNIKHNIKRSEH